jgi:alkanesulfonate monooxygenase SsuD/methylene tetrahydromethanopterin reductase-like flavin-dependent oxidoreductase (luciferase family)
MTLKLGVYGMPTDRDGLDFIVEAERLGIDSIWVPEFWGYDALTGLGAAAAVTDTIKLGTAAPAPASRR